MSEPCRTGMWRKNRYFSTNNVPDSKKRKGPIGEDFIEKINGARALSTEKTKMLSFADVLNTIGKGKCYLKYLAG